jgi:hypothetical protein
MKLAQTKARSTTPQSFLFTFRLWQTRDAQGDSAWRGKLESVTTGQVRYLNDLQSVTAQLRELLRELEAESHSQEENHVA